MWRNQSFSILFRFLFSFFFHHFVVININLILQIGSIVETIPQAFPANTTITLIGEFFVVHFLFFFFILIFNNNKNNNIDFIFSQSDQEKRQTQLKARSEFPITFEGFPPLLLFFPFPFYLLISPVLIFFF